MNIVVVGIGNVGLSIARLLVARHRLVLIDRSRHAALDEFLASHPEVRFIEADARDPELMQGALAGCFSGESLDRLLCTVGTRSLDAADTGFAGFARDFELNLFGNKVPVMAALGRMKAQRSGKLALISSTSGHHAPGDLTAYAPSKWALESLCAALRSELRGHGVALDSASLTTLRNRHSEVFTTDSGLDPERTAAVIARRMERPTGAAYFHPRRYRGVHWLERLAPGVLDARAGLGSGRRVRFRAMALRRGLITGASSGLGRELARLYAARLEELWLVARSGGALAALGRELEAAHGCRIHPRVVDMADLPAVAALADELDGIDLLVNNAGARLEGETDATPLELVERVYATNFLGAVRLTGRLLERGRLPAKVVNVLSTTAVAGRRRLGAYGGSKAALWCFTRSLRRVAGNDHQVLEVVPATFASSLFEKGIRIDAPGSPPTRTPPSARRLEARAVAERIAAAEAAGRERLFVPGEARLFLWLEALAPPLFRRLFP